MKRIEHLAVIAHDLGLIFEFLGIASLLPFLVLIIFGEWNLLLPMATVPVTFIGVGYLISRMPHEDIAPSFSATLSAVALAWLSIAFVGALPFMFGMHMSYTDSVFEAMAGWTGTAFTMIPSLDQMPNTLLFWRSFMQWIGGIGIIVFGVSLRGKTRASLFRLYRAEGREAELVSSSVSTSRRMWMIYLVLTFGFTGMIMLTGISLWDSLNLVMTTIATGGFTLHDGGLSYYNNPALEGLLIPVMLAGAIPFKVFFFLYNGNVMGMLRDRTVRILLLIALVGSAIISCDLFLSGSFSPLTAIREGTFTAISAICTCGLQNSNIHYWATVPLAIITMMVFIGGAMGSTAGGVKINRLVIGYEGIVWWFRRFFVSSRVIIPLRIGGRTHAREQSHLTVSKNLLVIVIYVLTIFVTTVVTLHLYITSFPLEQVVFEIVSALSNAGLTVGFIGPSSPLFLKWEFIALMWLGRLEIAPVLIIAMGIFKGVRDDIAADADSGDEPEFR